MALPKNRSSFFFARKRKLCVYNAEKKHPFNNDIEIFIEGAQWQYCYRILWTHTTAPAMCVIALLARLIRFLSLLLLFTCIGLFRVSFFGSLSLRLSPFTSAVPSVHYTILAKVTLAT